ncbi:hypothetical protein FRB91_002364 [Serendipita sp. 411]|nr:hypothetical protein FRB91_002364 [Serendipita sp. 411]
MRLSTFGLLCSILPLIAYSTVATATAIDAHAHALFPRQASSNSSQVTIDNEGSQIQYKGDWVLQPDGILYGSYRNFSGGSVSYTTRRGDSFSIIFTGTSISYYGPSFITHATFNVTLDGEHVGTCHTAISNAFNLQTLLWSSDPPLVDKEHTLTITHDDLQGTFLMVDRLVFTQVPSSLPSSSIPAALPNSTATNNNESSPANEAPANKKGVIIGAVLGSVIGIALLLILILFLLRKSTSQTRGYASQRDFTNPTAPYRVRGRGYTNIGAFFRIGSQNKRRDSVTIDGNKWENAGSRPPRGGGVSGMVQRVRYTLEGKVLDLKRGSGTTTGSYADDKAVAVPHIYNSFKSDVVMNPTRAKGNPLDNTLLSSGPAVPFQIPVRDSPNRSPISATFSNTVFGNNGQTEPAVNMAPLQFSQRPPGPYGTITRSSSLSSLQNKALPTVPPQAHISSSPTRPHPYAPYAHDFASSVNAGLLNRLSADSQAKMNGIGGYRSTETGMWVISRNPFASSSRHSSIDAGTGARAESGPTEMTGGRIHQEPTGPSTLPIQVDNQTQAPSTQFDSLQNLREQRMQHERSHPFMHSQNNSVTSFSSYADATTADGLAKSFTAAPLARVDSWSSSLRSKRFSNQLFSR